MVYGYLLEQLSSGPICFPSEVQNAHAIEALKGIITTGAETKSSILMLAFHWGGGEKNRQLYEEYKGQYLWIQQLLIPTDPAVIIHKNMGDICICPTSNVFARLCSSW